MISIFHKEATGVESQSSSHRVPFCFIVNTLTKLQENIIIVNRDFPKVVFKKKIVILDSYIKWDISSWKLLSQKPSCHSQYLQNSSGHSQYSLDHSQYSQCSFIHLQYSFIHSQYSFFHSQYSIGPFITDRYSFHIG